MNTADKDALHAAIMKLRCPVIRSDVSPSFREGHGLGFRDARHAAAELVAVHPAEMMDTEVQKSETAHPVVGLPCKDLPTALSEDAMHMTLCEFGKLVPRPGQVYIGVHIPGCEECDRIAASQLEAYGKSSPTVNKDGSLGAASEAVAGSAIPNEGSQTAHPTSQERDDLQTALPEDTRDASGVPAGEWGGLTPKQAWWAGYRVGKGLPPDMPRSEAVRASPNHQGE